MRQAGRRVSAILMFLIMNTVIGSSGFAVLPVNYDERVNVSAKVMASASSIINSSPAIASAVANLGVMGVTSIAADVRGSGTVQTIAVVDTGVDPLLPGFRDSRGISRIAGWIDFTNEGTAAILGRYVADDGYISIGDTKLNVASLGGRSGIYYIGTLPLSIQRHLKGSTTYFALFDYVSKGTFDAVALDVNGDMSFLSDPVLRKFQDTGTCLELPIADDETLTLVLSEIGDDLQTVVFGFDGNGHGTAMATIAAGAGPATYSGVSPRSKILAIKAIESDGFGTWITILEGINYALGQGADIVLVGACPTTSPDQSTWYRIEKRAADLGVPIILPAGNEGPGVGTVRITKTTDTVLIVGGYLPASSSKILLDNGITADNWYVYSSSGPDSSGNSGVDVISPAIAAVPQAGYHSRVRFTVMDGTSVSAAYAAGCVALLRQVADIGQGGLSSARVIAAIKASAEPLVGLLPVEEGSGRINIRSAWLLYKDAFSVSRLSLSRKWDGVVASNGLYLRGTSLGAVPIWIDNLDPISRFLTLQSTAPWLRALSTSLSVPAVSQRIAWLQGQAGLPPGFYCADLRCDDVETQGIDAKMTVSLALGHSISNDVSGSTPQIVFDMDPSRSSRTSRQFINVPESVETMSLSITGVPAGATFALYNPDSILVHRETLSEPRTSLNLGLPTSGLWQIVLLSDTVKASDSSAARILVQFTGVAVVRETTLLDGTTYAVYASELTSAKDLKVLMGAEWHYHRSQTLPLNVVTTISYPEIGADVSAISLRVGTVSGSTAKAYIYHYSDAAKRWVELGSCASGVAGLGTVCLPNPEPGRYVAYIEGYSRETGVYAEIDCTVVKDVGSNSAVDLSTGVSRFNLPSRTSSPGIKYAVLSSGSNKEIHGVLEYPVITSDSIPFVQILGLASPEYQVRTIRAWTSQGYNLDIVITVGNTSYQLHEGRVTAWISGSDDVIWIFPGQNASLLLQHARP